MSDEAALCFLATELAAGEAAPEGTERLQVRWVPFTEALAMTLRGEITDALSILGLQRPRCLRAPGILAWLKSG